eukprot:gene6081-2682_t
MMDTAGAQLSGWMKTALLIVDTAAAQLSGWMKTALLVLYIKPGVLDLADSGFIWVPGWEKSFDAVLQWADKVAQWDFNQVIPAHFAGPVAASSKEFRQAFAFLESPETSLKQQKPNFLERFLGRKGEAVATS